MSQQEVPVLLRLAEPFSRSAFRDQKEESGVTRRGRKLTQPKGVCHFQQRRGPPFGGRPHSVESQRKEVHGRPLVHPVRHLRHDSKSNFRPSPLSVSQTIA